jgi:hypothetical protein
MAESICNYDEKRIFLSFDGFVCIKRATKEKSMRLGRKGTTLGTLLAIVGANGFFWLTVWIFAATGPNHHLHEHFPKVETRLLDDRRCK